jgi:MFS family permease
MSTTSLFYGSGSVAKNSLFQNHFSDKQRATMGSLNSFGKSISFAIGATFFGFIADLTSPRISLIWGQVIGFITIWLTWKLFKLIKTETV